MKMNKFFAVTVSLMVMLWAGLEVSAQRSSTSRSASTTSSSSTSSSSVRGNSDSATRSTASQREHNVASRSSNATTRTSASNTKKTNVEAKPTMEQRGPVQTGTVNKRLKPEHVSPAENYKKLPVRGTVVSKSKATKSAHFVRYGATDYYFKKGVFYSYDPMHNHYIVSRPPVGLIVPTIPQSRIIYLNDVNYYYYYGVFYRRVNTYYEVVTPPVGAIVESIPDGYEQLIINGNTYYIVDGVQYKAVVYHGEIWYEVIKLMD